MTRCSVIDTHLDVYPFLSQFSGCNQGPTVEIHYAFGVLLGGDVERKHKHEIQIVPGSEQCRRTFIPACAFLQSVHGIFRHRFLWDEILRLGRNAEFLSLGQFAVFQ